MGDRKLLWILLGLTLTFLVISAKHTGRQQQKAEEDFAEEEFEEDDDDDDDEECDPSCEKKCHRLKCPLGFVRDSCGCCECASSEGEYCYFTSIKEREGQKTNLNFKGPPKKSSFLSLTPFSTNASSSKSSFLTKTLFTNKNLVSPNDDDHDQSYHQNGPPGPASSSFPSPTFTKFSATTTTDPTTNTATSSTGGRRRNEKKQSKGRPQGSLKISNRGGKYSSESNDRSGKKKDFFPYDDIIYRTCGDYLECKPFLFTSEEEEERPQDGGRSPHHTPIIPPFRGDDDASQNLGLPNPKKLRFKNGGESKSRFIKQLKRKGLYLGRSSSSGGNSWEHYQQQQHQQKRLLGRAQGAQGAEIKENHFNWLQNPKEKQNPNKLTDDNQVYSDDEDYLFNSFSRFSSSSSSPLFSTTRLGPKSQKLTLVLGTCVCRYPVTVCASDGRTYRNICHLRSASALSNPEVHAVKEGPCDPPVPEGMKPKIVSGPEYVKNVTGGTAALSCEVTGYPIPFISWLKTNVNNNTFDLPGDDKSIMTLTQGGPEKHEITAWIQIIGLRKDHEGDYSCVAFNKHGTARASNRLKVQKKRGKRRNKNKRK